MQRIKLIPVGNPESEAMAGITKLRNCRTLFLNLKVFIVDIEIKRSRIVFMHIYAKISFFYDIPFLLFCLFNGWFV